MIQNWNLWIRIWIQNPDSQIWIRIQNLYMDYMKNEILMGSAQNEIKESESNKNQASKSKEKRLRAKVLGFGIQF